MPTVTISITQLLVPANLTEPITVSLYYRQFYATSWTLIDANVVLNLDGTISASPLPQITINTETNYQLQAINQLCGYEYVQNLIVTPYCPIGYEMSADGTYCYYQVITAATPPTNPQNSVAATDISYSTCGSYYYNPGYSTTLGTGTSTQISPSNAFWVNGAGACADNSTSAGPLNRAGLWTSIASSNQTIGFAVCLNIPTDTTYYIGMGNDNYGSVNLDGVNILTQNEAALDAQYSNGGACFKVWHIYPVTIPAGQHILELIGTNVAGPAALGFEIYDNTIAQIIAATSYAGLNLIFSTMNYIGMPIQEGSGGIGYSCPEGYALAYCDSPIICVKTITSPVLYG